MNTMKYENQGTNTYLVYEIREDDRIDSLSLGMLTNNKIPGLASTLFTQMDSSKFIKYNVSAKVSVKQFFSGVVNKKRLIGVFSGITDAMLSAEDYMIDTNTILLDLDYIFADVSTCETVLICLPVEREDSKNPDLGSFFKNIMFNTQFDQTENCDHVAKIINYLNSTPVFSLAEFHKLLADLSNTGSVAATVKTSPNPQPRVVSQPQQRAVPMQTAPAKTAQAQAAPMQQTAFSAERAANYAKQPLTQNQAPRPAQGQNMQARPMAPSPAQTANNGEKMSRMYLLQHYNKENAAIYKSQKNVKKSVNATPAQNKNNTRPVNTSYAVPGAAPAPVGFAVPGVPAPAAKQANRAPAPQQVKAPTAPRPVSQQPAAPQTFSQPTVPQGQPMNFGETTILGGASIGETTVLGAGPQANQTITPFLVRAKNNERILLNKPVFRIGKERSYVDYFIGDNTAISRSHANIITRDGEYFVVDTNSTNHTYVNGVIIKSNVETKIEHSARIRLANEDFTFNMY